MIEIKSRTYHFLEGGGEMGRLTRSFDWSHSALGPVDAWPQSLRTIVDVMLHSAAPMLLWWGDELIQFYNDAYRPSLGQHGKHPAALGQRGEECWPEIWPVIKPLIDQVREGGAVYREDQLIPIFRNGKMEDVYWTFGYSPVRDESGQIAGVLVICQETTQQVLARKKVEQSEAMLRNIIIKAPVAMCILRGPEFVVDIANDLMFRLWGKQRAELQGKPIFEGLPEVQHQGFEEILDNVYRTGESFTADAVPISLPRDGSIETVFVNFLYEAYRESDNRISGVLAVATDVTEEVKARHVVEQLVNERTRELAESNQNLKRSNDELAQFAYIASHDLQEPARKINTFIEMLQTNLTDIDQRSKNLLSKVEYASCRMLSLIRDVLAYSQLASEKQATSVINLNEVIKSVLEDFELLVEEKKAKIECDTLPTIEGIPVQIHQLFANLVSNALKFSLPDSSPEITISAKVVGPGQAKIHADLKPGHRYHRISFSDNGIGFNQKNARQIFDIFQRLHGKTEYAGTGIGLAMCKKIAQNHRGDIVAESAEGKGATFHVFLPLAEK